MESVGVPAPQLLLVGAVVFLVVGSLSIIVGYEARIGAGLLLVFLILASYYFHAFWKLKGQAQQDQMIQFLKNLSMMGAMFFIVANGAGSWSVDARRHFPSVRASSSWRSFAPKLQVDQKTANQNHSTLRIAQTGSPARAHPNSQALGVKVLESMKGDKSNKQTGP
jgi:putative oxidoreductase